MKTNAHRTMEIELESPQTDNKTLRALRKYGGIEQVLNECLSQKISALENDRLDETEKIDSNNDGTTYHKTKRSLNKHITSSDLNKTDGYCNNAEFSYDFDKQNTSLEKYFGPQKAAKIKKIFNSMVIKCVLAFTIIVYNVLNRFPRYRLGTIYHPIYSITFNCVLWLPYSVYILLHINRNGLKLIRKTFEFWFKIIISVTHFIAIYLDYFILHHNNWQYLYLAILERVLFGIVFCFVVTCISCYDALHVSVRWKVLIAGLVAFNATLWSTWSMFIISNNDIHSYTFLNYSLIKIGPYIAISLTSLQISTMRILAIFLWRQAVCSLIWPNKSILIRNKPHIIWTTKETNHKPNKPECKERHNDAIAMQIVEIMGGIEDIIAHYDHGQSIALDQQKLDKISKLTAAKDFRKKEVYYYFRSTDSFLYALFDERGAKKLNDIFHSKMLKIIFCVSMFVYIICRFGARLVENKKYETDYFAVFLMIQILIVSLIAMPYAIFFMLSFHKYAFKLVVIGFEFWLKLFYAIMYVTTSSVNNLVLNPNQKHPHLMRTWQILVGIWYIFGVIIVSSLDTIQLDRKWKLIILTPASVMVLLWTSFLMFGSVSNEDKRGNSVIAITSDIAISLLMLEISGIRVVAIFFWKQLFSSCNKTNKAASIIEIPVIRWKDQ